jgi:nucleotide-binding universal stress UspA family protein
MADLVLGYDGSECAKAALRKAIELSSELGDRIVIAYGYDPGIPGEEHDTHQALVRKMGETATAEAVATASEAGVEVEVDLRAERPAEALLSVAEERDARAIVVGTFGEHPIKGAILGSVPHRLLHLSERPVLVVPAET